MWGAELRACLEAALLGCKVGVGALQETCSQNRLRWEERRRPGFWGALAGEQSACRDGHGYSLSPGGGVCHLKSLPGASLFSYEGGTSTMDPAKGVDTSGVASG